MRLTRRLLRLMTERLTCRLIAKRDSFQRGEYSQGAAGISNTAPFVLADQSLNVLSPRTNPNIRGVAPREIQMGRCILLHC